MNNNNNNPFLGDLQKKLFPPKSAADSESVGNPEIDDIDGISDEDDDEIEIKSDSPTIRVSWNVFIRNKFKIRLKRLFLLEK